MRTFIDVVLACGVIGWFVYPFFTTGKKSASVTSGQVDNGPQEAAHEEHDVNIDGTPMVGMLDMHGKPYGFTSSPIGITSTFDRY